MFLKHFRGNFLDNDYNFEKIIVQIIEELIDFTNLIINDNNYKDQILKILST